MRDYLKHYRVKICVLSPVYIGSGEKIGKKEHIYMPWNHHVIIPNVEKMYMDLQKKGLGKEFADYMMDGRSKGPSLSQWLDSIRCRGKIMRDGNCMRWMQGKHLFHRQPDQKRSKPL